MRHKATNYGAGTESEISLFHLRDLVYTSEAEQPDSLLRNLNLCQMHFSEDDPWSLRGAEAKRQAPAELVYHIESGLVEFTSSITKAVFQTLRTNTFRPVCLPEPHWRDSEVITTIFETVERYGTRSILVCG